MNDTSSVYCLVYTLVTETLLILPAMIHSVLYSSDERDQLPHSLP